MGDSVIRIGRVLSDNYRIERVIGRGGMATVFEASHLRLPIRVALKVITAPLDDAQEFLIRFRREAETLARLEHPHVVSVYDWNVTDDGLPYLVMELLCGEDLTQRLRKTPRLPKRLALHIFSQIAQALHGHWLGGDIDFDEADSWILVGTNPVVTKATGIPGQNPAYRLRNAIKRGMKLIVIDPRVSQTAARATMHIQPRPGEDASILAGLINVIINENLCDTEFLAANVDGFGDLAAAVAPFTPEYVAERADIPAQQLIDAARLFVTAGPRPGQVHGATGLNFATHGNLTEYLCLALMTIVGSWQRERLCACLQWGGPHHGAQDHCPAKRCAQLRAVHSGERRVYALPGAQLPVAAFGFHFGGVLLLRRQRPHVRGCR